MSNRPFDAERAQLVQHGRARAWLIAIPLIAIAVALYWWSMHKRAPAPPLAVAPTPAESAAAAAAAEEAADQRAAHALTSTGEGTDERVRQELGPLSPRPEWQAWLAATHDLVESCAVLIANVADDEDPRRRLAPLRPGSQFETVEQGGHTVESLATMHRYDTAVEVISSLDTRAFAPIWHTLHPLIAISYRTVARPGASLDDAAGSALKRISSASVSNDPSPLRKVGRIWLYTDPDVERRGTLEKILQRMGPENARKLQAKAVEFRQALALP